MSYNDIIFKPNNNEELIDVQRMGFRYDYRWWGDYPNGIKFEDISKCEYIIFSIDGIDNRPEDKHIFSFYDLSKDQVIQTNIFFNKGHYQYFDNYKEFKNAISKTIKQIDYNTPRKLVYENKDIQVIKFQDFTDFDNIEYRKGSKEYGGILTKLLEFLRIYKTNDSDTIEFDINDFEKESNMTIDDIKKLIESRESGQKLFDFDIIIDNDRLIISNLNKIGKNRPFESNNN